MVVSYDNPESVRNEAGLPAGGVCLYNGNRDAAPLGMKWFSVETVSIHRQALMDAGWCDHPGKAGFHVAFSDKERKVVRTSDTTSVSKQKWEQAKLAGAEAIEVGDHAAIQERAVHIATDLRTQLEARESEAAEKDAEISRMRRRLAELEDAAKAASFPEGGESAAPEIAGDPDEVAPRRKGKAPRKAAEKPEA